MLLTLLFCILAYLIGSISSAIITCRLMGLPDPRTQGSKNPGATNVLRVGGKKAAIITLLGDALKGVIPVAIAMIVRPSPLFVGLVMISVFLGHLYPIFFGFEGGKGVATAIGAILGLSWPVGIMVILTWGLIAFWFRISSLAALTAALLAPFYVWMWMGFKFAVPVAVMSAILFWRHKANIQRLLAGIEPKLTKK